MALRSAPNNRSIRESVYYPVHSHATFRPFCNCNRQLHSDRHAIRMRRRGWRHPDYCSTTIDAAGCNEQHADGIDGRDIDAFVAVVLFVLFVRVGRAPIDARGGAGIDRHVVRVRFGLVGVDLGVLVGHRIGTRARALAAVLHA